MADPTRPIANPTHDRIEYLCCFFPCKIERNNRRGTCRKGVTLDKCNHRRETAIDIHAECVKSQRQISLIPIPCWRYCQCHHCRYYDHPLASPYCRHVDCGNDGHTRGS